MTRFCSTIREMAKVAAMHSGKVAARTPMVVPMTLRVRGAIAVIKIMNGIGLMMLTMTLRVV